MYFRIRTLSYITFPKSEARAGGLHLKLPQTKKQTWWDHEDLKQIDDHSNRKRMTINRFSYWFLDWLAGKAPPPVCVSHSTIHGATGKLVRFLWEILLQEVGWYYLRHPAPRTHEKFPAIWKEWFSKAGEQRVNQQIRNIDAYVFLASVLITLR